MCHSSCFFSCLGCIESKVKYKIHITSETRIDIMNNKLFAILKQYPERSWYFELNNDMMDEDDSIDTVKGDYSLNLFSQEDVESTGISSELWSRLLRFDQISERLKGEQEINSLSQKMEAASQIETCAEF